MAGPDVPHQDPLQYFPVVIANGASLSEAVDLRGLTLVGIKMPDSWTTADLTIQAGITAADTFGDVYDDAGAELEIAAEAAIFIRLDPAKMSPFRHVKLRSGTSGTPANQGAARTLYLVARLI